MSRRGARRLRHDTGHDVHFLERLDRVSLDQTELALRLYRDRELVARLLADRALPDGAERVAIAIDGGAQPAHVVVARDGAFVTCLAPGMRPAENPVIPWPRVEGHLRRADLQERQLEAARAVPAALVRRIHEAGPLLSREEFLQLSALEPLLHRQVALAGLRTFLDMMHDGFALARLRRVRPADEPLRRRFWRRYHAAGHVLLLATYGGRRDFDWWERLETEHGTDPFLGWLVLPACLGHAPLALRAYWAMGRAEKDALRWLRAVLAGIDDFDRWTAALMSLLVVGLRYRKLRAEVRRMFTGLAPPPALAAFEGGRFVAGWFDVFATEWLAGDGADPEAERERWRARGAALLAADPCAAALRAALPPGDVPFEVAAAYQVNRHLEFSFKPSNLGELAELARLVALMRGEDFYFPAACVEILADRCTPERVDELCWCHRPPQPVRRARPAAPTAPKAVTRPPKPDAKPLEKRGVDEGLKPWKGAPPPRPGGHAGAGLTAATTARDPVPPRRTARRAPARRRRARAAPPTGPLPVA
ncbi:MAG: hypothetical protein HY906_14630 [Deltaproteobacteria bacterium]|nr:hypothetical protein [Deltaproteobacteria bacterium]